MVAPNLCFGARGDEGAAVAGAAVELQEHVPNAPRQVFTFILNDGDAAAAAGDDARFTWVVRGSLV